MKKKTESQERDKANKNKNGQIDKDGDRAYIQ